MRQHSLAKRTGLRRAIVGSVVIHMLIAVLGVVVLPRTQSQGTTPHIDTRADDVVIHLAISDVPVVMPAAPPEPETPAPQSTPEPTPPDSPPEPDPPPPEPVVEPAIPQPTPTPNPPRTTARRPTITAVPNALPSTMLQLIRKTDTTAASAAHSLQNTLDIRPFHGTMMPGQTVVYALDCSGSMGEFGKFGLARAALVVTLRQQNPEVRFQVITYNSTARAVLNGGCVPATPENIAAAEAGLATRTPTGRSHHVEAVRAALALRPTVIVLLTDAGDLTAAKLRSTVPVCVAPVTAHGVGPPCHLR